METDTIVCADVMDYLRSLPDESVNCIVTSPPYWNLRKYGGANEIGREKDPRDYVGGLAVVFHAARRVLRSDGTLWLNLGDVSKNKQLLGLPWRVALALKDDGWMLRSDIIWVKESVMPESVKDRPSRVHEYVFMFSKSKTYYYDAAAIAEPTKPESNRRANRAVSGSHKNIDVPGRRIQTFHKARANGEGYTVHPFRNKRDVWTVNPQPFKGAHFATFPPKLIEPMIKAGCPVGGTVLDCFMGSGTTAVVARAHDRHYIGCDSNQSFVDMANERLRTTDPYLPREQPDGWTQQAMFAEAINGR